jgi:membrane protease YdiL (CAAX protease family)
VIYWDGYGWGPMAVQQHTAERLPYEPLPVWVALGAIASIIVPLVASRTVLDDIARLGLPLPVDIAISALMGYGPCLAWWWWASRRLGSGLRSTAHLSARVVDTGWGPLTWLCCVVAQVAVAAIVLGFDVPTTSNTDAIRDQRTDIGFAISIILLAAVVAPIVEEIVFRGLVLRGFAGVMHPAVAIGLQGVVFGAVHINPDFGTGNIGLVAVLSGVGVVLGGAAYIFRRIAPSMIAHAIINAIAVAVALSGWEPPPPPS